MEVTMAGIRTKKWEQMGRADLVSKIIDVLQETYQCSGKDLAKYLGLSYRKITNWKQNGACQKGNVESLLNAIVKHAIKNSYIPIAELKAIKSVRKGNSFEIGIRLSQKLMQKIQVACSGGIYIFYDSRGKAIYAGQSKKSSSQSLWKEMNAAFKRKRTSQTIICDDCGHLKKKSYYLHEVSKYVTIYLVHEFAIKDFEALLIRSFPNDLTNIRMETKSKTLEPEK